jgi:excisionase family DNA binding protein
MASPRTVPKRCPEMIVPAAPKAGSSRDEQKRPHATRNAAVKKSARNKNKRRSPLDKLAKMLNIPRSTIYLYAQQLKLPCIRFGNRYVLPDDMEERLTSLAWENWRPPNEKLHRGDAKTESSTPGGQNTRSWHTSATGTTAVAKRRRTGGVWLSPRQFAYRFGVGAGAVYGAVARGEVPSIRVGRHIRIPPDSIEVILRRIT